MIKYALTIFISAFLVFQIQPIVAKFMMPLFGGASTVWIVCVVFFQVFLLLGYLYAYWLSLLRSSFVQGTVHVGLLAIALMLFLPINPVPNVEALTAFSPSMQILFTLMLSVGVPYMLLSASGPLIQNWFRLEFVGVEPYRLYALSNLGSLLGLLLYPLAVEPTLDITQQSWTWSAGFVVYFVLCAFCLKALHRTHQISSNSEPSMTPSEEPPQVSDVVLWVVLAATASMLLLAVTNQLTMDIASIPFLWILPLVVYLITFILCFEKPILYQRWVWMPLLLVAVGVTITAIIRGSNVPFMFQLLAYSSILFIGCMVCHGELYRCKPAPAYLTKYYLFLSLGGAVGGLFVALIAPNMFDGYWEMQLIVVLLLMIVGLCLMRDFIIKVRIIELSVQVIWTLVLVFVGFLFMVDIQNKSDNNIHQSRSFYGVLKVSDIAYDEPDGVTQQQKNLRIVKSGAIVHGTQLQIGGRPVFEPSSYYGAESGVGIAIDLHGRSSVNKPSVGVIGMGAATIATLCEGCKSMHFFEIDPDMVALEKTYFGNTDWLRGQGVPVTTIVGDGRLSIAEFDNEFDVLAVDAFSGDAIPVHLLTYEAVQMYFRSMTDGGVLALHISNRHLNLAPALANLAKELDAHIYTIKNRALDDKAVYISDWVLITMDEETKLSIERDYGCDETQSNDDTPFWTDKYSNVLSIIGHQSGFNVTKAQSVTCYAFQ